MRSSFFACNWRAILPCKERKSAAAVPFIGVRKFLKPVLDRGVGNESDSNLDSLRSNTSERFSDYSKIVAIWFRL